MIHYLFIIIDLTSIPKILIYNQEYFKIWEYNLLLQNNPKLKMTPLLTGSVYTEKYTFNFQERPNTIQTSYNKNPARICS
jgi:hypothetical protein